LSGSQSILQRRTSPPALPEVIEYGVPGNPRLGINDTFLVHRFKLSQPGAVYAVKIGKRIAKGKDWKLVE